MFQPQVLLHPTDYSDCARYAFEVAVHLAHHSGARLIVVHVAETLGPEKVSVGEVGRQRQPAGHLDHLHRELNQIVPEAGIAVPVIHILAEGDPGAAIARIAAANACDLIVMGTYGRTALSRLLSGSVTQKVSQLARCAILTVRMPAP